VKPPRPALVGLIVCAFLGVVDIVSVVGAGADDGPPIAIVLIGAVLGAVTLYGVRQAWSAWPRGRTLVGITRVLSALLGVPVFFTDDAPDWAPPAVGVQLVLTVVALALLYLADRRPATV
jgi:hypothetical protein